MTSTRNAELGVFCPNPECNLPRGHTVPCAWRPSLFSDERHAEGRPAPTRGCPVSGGCEVERRWEEGIPHDRRSMALYKSLEQIDLANDDYFCWKAGGDGDNGERLMYLLDIHFAKLNSAPPPGEEREDGE